MKKEEAKPRGSSRKPAGRPDADGMLSEYDFRGGVHGKYAERFAAGTNIAVLEPDVAKAFPTSRDVNRALRSLLPESGTHR